MGGSAASVLARARDSLAESRADVKWAESFHVTAAFLGKTDESLLPALRRCLAEAAAEAAPPSEAALDRLGAFPSWRRPRVVWAGVGPGAGDLAAAERAVRRRLAAAGFPTEERPFLPHVTLGRVRTPRGLDALLAAARPWDRPEAWAGASFACGPLRIVSSVLTPKGAVHTVLP